MLSLAVLYIHLKEKYIDVDVLNVVLAFTFINMYFKGIAKTYVQC